MSIVVNEKRVQYDNPCAPLVKFANSNSRISNDIDDDEEDMTDDHPLSNIQNDTLLNPSIGEHTLKTLSLEDLVKSFDNTINACFTEQEIIESNDPETPQEDLVASSSTWSELIENLRCSLRTDLKLPHIAQSCQTAMHSIYQQSKIIDNELISIDDLNEDEEEELREQLDMHSIIISSTNIHHEPFLTAEQVISEIDFMLQDMTPDSGYCDDQSSSDMLDLRTRRVHYLSSSINNDELDLKLQSIYSLNELYEELNGSVKELSSALVQELANRDELEFEKETKNTFISLVLSIQNKRRHCHTDKRQKRRSILGNSNAIEPGTMSIRHDRSVFDVLSTSWKEMFQKAQYLTTVIPFDREHLESLSVEYLQSLNKILNAINEDSAQVPELLTNYILKVLCPC